ncbi:nonselective cation channel [Xylaria bambusicola]|uniref:nonselective cation channel n=1 Tax=Xylaria bambusicola TaxID=326684 RepID=UPI002008DB82|nr:nonselective cation channel [Xylaria bambusicola]KAI0514776.1 nonselective cation channel [Xylaria bambusicola]
MATEATTQLLRAQDPEQRPLLNRSMYSYGVEDGPFFSCTPNPHSHLPVYTTIHRIRRDVMSIVEDYLTFEQLGDLRLNVSVVRPLVDKLYELDDISIVYCLLVNRSQFLHEQEHMSNRQNVHYTRAMLCEVVATRILRRFGDDNPGSEGLLLLANLLVAGFEPFQNAPEEIRREASLDSRINYHRTLPALEIAILTGSRYFLSSTYCKTVVDAIYIGQIVYTPSTFLDLIPDRYKRKPISLYQPHKEALLNQYRLIVPRTRNMLEIMQFIILLMLYVLFMLERDPTYLSVFELAFAVYAFGWALDQFATILEHGLSVYAQNLWSFLDVIFIIVYWMYLILRVHGWRMGVSGQPALDVLAMGAPVLIPRLAFNLLSENIVFLSLRAMMADFAVLTFLAAWCFFGFLLSMVWLAEGRHDPITISKWMLWIWFGLDGSGVSESADFHWLLGPVLMITFAFLGNTLFLTILVSMLTNTFANVVTNATAEIHFRKAVLTLEGVKSDAIFAYQPPFNIIALFILVPMKFLVSPRWFHKIHVAFVRAINFPILLLIAILERRLLWSKYTGETQQQQKKKYRGKGRFWEKWRITSHSDIQTVFDIPPPDSVEEDIAVDDELTHHMIRRQLLRHQSSSQPRGSSTTRDINKEPPPKAPSRRDSLAPLGVPTDQVRSLLGESGHAVELSARLASLERTSSRIEAVLEKMFARISHDDDGSLEEDERKESEVDIL